MRPPVGETGTTHPEGRVGPSPRLQDCPDGPLLVRGARVWTDADGTEHPVTRPVVAICRCDKSQRLPWCDGTHKFIAAR